MTRVVCSPVEICLFAMGSSVAVEIAELGNDLTNGSLLCRWNSREAECVIE